MPKNYKDVLDRTYHNLKSGNCENSPWFEIEQELLTAGYRIVRKDYLDRMYEAVNVIKSQ